MINKDFYSDIDLPKYNKIIWFNKERYGFLFWLIIY
jgi:hypothetical protein